MEGYDALYRLVSTCEDRQIAKRDIVRIAYGTEKTPPQYSQYFQKIVTGQKRLVDEYNDIDRRKDIYEYCVSELGYQGSLSDLFTKGQIVKQRLRKQGKYYDEDLNVRIRIAIDHNGKSISKIAQDGKEQGCQFSRTMLEKYYSGEQQPQARQFDKLAKVLDVVTPFLDGRCNCPLGRKYEDIVLEEIRQSREFNTRQAIVQAIAELFGEFYESPLKDYISERGFYSESDEARARIRFLEFISNSIPLKEAIAEAYKNVYMRFLDEEGYVYETKEDGKRLKIVHFPEKYSWLDSPYEEIDPYNQAFAPLILISSEMYDTEIYQAYTMARYEALLWVIDYYPDFWVTHFKSDPESAKTKIRELQDFESE